jgi:hypothetical protein
LKWFSLPNLLPTPILVSYSFPTLLTVAYSFFVVIIIIITTTTIIIIITIF